MRIKARERYILIGGDYSQQEPKMLAVLSKDDNMMKAASEGKDLYSAVASKAFKVSYEECCEFFPKGTPIIKDKDKWRYATEEEIKNKEYSKLADGVTDTYKDGKNRRKQAKVILLGMMYSRGPKALAEQLGCSIAEARDIMDFVFDAFPSIKKCETESKEFAKKHGYTTTLWGRKRRLPDLQLPPYEFDFSKSDYVINMNNEYQDKINNADSEEEKQQLENEREEKISTHKKDIEKEATKELEKAYWDREERQKIIDKYKKEYKVSIKVNTGFIAQAERQVLNSRIQGSAAEMSKLAMKKIHQDKRLKELGFQMLIPIHDEIIGECPLVNARECRELFIEDMATAAEDKVKLKITVDPVCSFEWYGEEVEI